MIGIVVYSVVKNSFGFFTLIPQFFAYKLVNKSKKRSLNNPFKKTKAEVNTTSRAAPLRF